MKTRNNQNQLLKLKKQTITSLNGLELSKIGGGIIRDSKTDCLTYGDNSISCPFGPKPESIPGGTR